MLEIIIVHVCKGIYSFSPSFLPINFFPLEKIMEFSFTYLAHSDDSSVFSKAETILFWNYLSSENRKFHAFRGSGKEWKQWESKERNGKKNIEKNSGFQYFDHTQIKWKEQIFYEWWDSNQ